MEKDKMIEKVCEKMCAVYYDDDGTCSLDGVLCHDDKHCARRQNAKDLIDELFPEGAVVLTKEEIETTDKIPQKIKDFYDLIIEIAKEQARKETAREILFEIINRKERFVDSWEMVTEIVTVEEIKMVAEEYGVEVEK